MQFDRRSKRGFAPIAVIGILALVVLGAVYVSISGTKRVSDAADDKITGLNVSARPTNSSVSGDAEKLQTELQAAVKSGGVNPERYDAIVGEVRELQRRGVDYQTLEAIQSLLQQLAVGGSEPSAQIAKNSPQPAPQKAPSVDTRPFWEYDPSKPEKGWYWVRGGEPPACSEPLVIESPVEAGLATGILYPGQVRGDGPEDFKPHGGFTLKPNSTIELRAPMDGYLTNVARFTDEFGYHVGLTFQNPCGIQFGGGHWGSLPPDIQAVVDKVLIKGYGESRTEPIIPPYFVKKGQIIVTGLQEKANPERPGFDWGVTDYRQQNAASKDQRFRELYGYAPWNTYYGVCWLDLLPPEQKEVLKSLPGVDGKQGKNSEYCK